MEISLHSNQKHIALAYYLSIIRSLISSPKTPFKKLYYVDLYCGDGECEISRINQKYEPPIIESILKKINENFKSHCFLNDIQEDNIKKIKQKTEKYKEYITCFCDDANKIHQKILEKIPKDQFSIFFLDPYNHKQLKWNTIKEIANHVHVYFNKRENCEQKRRPELIINCMTYTMTNAYRAGEYKSINESLGTDEWLNRLQKHKDEGLNIPKAFLFTFIEQLEKIGYKIPTPIEIKTTKAGNDIYYLVWATNENSYKKIENDVIPYLKRTVNKMHDKNKKSLKQAEAREKGDSDLNNWTEK
jgi:three-Cys-motif partner protein